MRFGIRELIFLAVLLAVPVTSFWYVFKPRNEQIRQANEEIKLKQARMERLNEVLKRIPSLSEEIQKGQEAIDQLELQLPSEESVDTILEQVWQISKQNGLVVRSVKSERPVPFARYMELPLKTVIEGNWDGFYRFLLELEGLPRITRVQQLKLQKNTELPKSKDEPPPAGNMHAELTLSIFYECSQPAPAAPQS